MKNMSDATFRDRLPQLRRSYAAMRTRKAKTRLVDSILLPFPFERKYLIKLLSGNRGYRGHRGRAPDYGKDLTPILLTLWRAAGRPCAEHLHARLPRLAADHLALGRDIPGAHLALLRRISPSTIGRLLKSHRHEKPRKSNRHSGIQKLKDAIPALPGRELPEDTPGTFQLDTVSLCGGITTGSFFHIATLTDAATQWFECAPSWNHSAMAATRAMATATGRLPMPVHHAHPDNGSEFINHLFVNSLAALHPGARLTRSRPYRKNDNCRIEQKNGSVIRAHFGDIRLDDATLQPRLDTLCRDIALYTNLFNPSKKLIRKTRDTDRKGVHYRKRYDKPQTPLDRLAAHPGADPGRTRPYLELRERTNSILLLRSIKSQLRGIVKKTNAPSGGGMPPPDGVRPAPPSVSTHLTDALAENPAVGCPSLLT